MTAASDATAPDAAAATQGEARRTTYLDRLATRSAAAGTVLCLGIDPDPAALPPAFSTDVDGIERFARLLVEAAARHAAAVKPNLAFFEAFGSAGVAALERVRAAIPPDLPVVIDAKRGDIGSTAARQAVALFDGLGADAVTVSPYLGEEAIAPLLGRTDRFAYVLCRTSNPGAPEFQSLVVAPGDGDGTPAEPLYLHVARRASAWGPGGTIGLVVGATAPAELREIRAVAPGLPFLVPGVGAQGGEIGPVLAEGRATMAPGGGRPGGGLLVNVTRGIAAAAAGIEREADVAHALDRAAAEWAARLPVLP
ncbi:MAG: orotidine-5'-phosphate decarboxylase [Chloroflexota bacterium]